MKIAYFDCFSGISGDMVLGALVDAGCDLLEVEAQLRRLPVPDWKISRERVMRRGLVATHVKVETPKHHHHRSLYDILQLIERADLSSEVAERACGIFQRLGEAEAQVHDIAIEKVHFHEVGAVDAIIDIVGASAGFAQLRIDECVCSALNVGSGHVDTQHGRLPVPAPATAQLLRGAPTYSDGIRCELVTPTGAAIITTLASRFGAQPAMKVGVIGHGAGTTDLAEQPNILRLFVGEGNAAQQADETSDETVVVLEANLDDMNPQVYGYFVECALAAGALDVFAMPAQMKKNRPGQLVTVLCEPATCERLIGLIFRETTTLGVRQSLVKRRILRRESILTETPLGPIRVKVARLNGNILNVSPEYDDCRRVAAEQRVPLKQVLAQTTFQFYKQHGGK